MGWDEGYAIYEEQVVGLYNLGVLTPEVLKILVHPFKNTDIDHGGLKDLTTKDGLSADEVVLKVMNPKTWNKIENSKDRFHFVYQAFCKYVSKNRY